ncbi:MAG: hypothetical protein JXA94_03160 [Parachlamydiales bacterium]|nr:hypothetical protein [Parachlamydiales bacterium]
MNAQEIKYNLAGVAIVGSSIGAQLASGYLGAKYITNLNPILGVYQQGILLISNFVLRGIFEKILKWKGIIKDLFETLSTFSITIYAASYFLGITLSDSFILAMSSLPINYLIILVGVVALTAVDKISQYFSKNSNN